MTRIFSSQDEIRTFCDNLEQLLRKGKPETALKTAKSRLTQVEGTDESLVKLALAADFAGMSLEGWNQLGAHIAEVEKANVKVTALGIDLSNTCHSGSTPDNDGKLAPDLETSYYCDQDVICFSKASRLHLLDHLSDGAAPWQGCFQDIDHLVQVSGLERLYGTLTVSTHNRGKDDLNGDIFVVASCINAIVVHLAVKNTIETIGLPKPMTVIVGSNEEFPFFEAPVVVGEDSSSYVMPDNFDPVEDQSETNDQIPDGMLAYFSMVTDLAEIDETGTLSDETIDASPVEKLKKFLALKGHEKEKSLFHKIRGF